MSDIGLVLEGGAFRGVFTAGIVDFLIEKDVEFPYVVGVSAGACNMLGYISKQRGYAKRSIIQEKPEDRFYGLNHMVKSHKIIDLDRLCFEYPYNQNPFDFDQYFKSRSMGEMVVTNCESGKAEYLEENQSKDRLLLMTKASSSLPILTSMVEIDDHKYLDGGLADSIPIKRAIKKGFDKNVVVMTKNESELATLSKYEKLFCERHYRNYPNLVKTITDIPKTFDKTIKLIHEQEKSGHALVLRPELPMIKSYETDEDKLKRLYDHGYEIMKDNYELLIEFMKE